MNATLLVGFFGLLGVVLGWALTWWTNWWHERKHEAQVRRGVQLLLRLECNQNLAALFDFWRKVSQDGLHVRGSGFQVGVPDAGYEGEFDKRERLAYEPLPTWRRLMWESQAGLVAAALRDATTIDRVYTLYADLEAFTQWRAELREVFDESEGQRVAQAYRDWILYRAGRRPTPGTSQDEASMTITLTSFNETTRSLWIECEAIYKRAFQYKDSNLLEDDVPARRWGDTLMRPVRWALRRQPNSSKQLETK